MTAELHSQVTADLRAMLGAGLDAAGRFEALLAEERRALESRDSTALAALAAQKQAAVRELEGLEARRLRALEQASVPNDAAGMLRLLAGADDQQRWQDYLALAGRCQQANLTNGAVIRLRHQQITEALAVLSGDRRETYGPNGSSRPAHSRALAEA